LHTDRAEVKLRAAFAKLYGRQPPRNLPVSTTRRRLIALSALPLSALALGACAMTGCTMMRPLHEQVVTINAPQMPGTAIEVEGHNGSATITRDAAARDISVVATLRMTSDQRLGETRIFADRDPATNALLIHATPPGGQWESREGISYAVVAPEARGVKVRTGNGSVRIAGLSGPADLQTSNGRIEAADHAGPVTAHTSNGSVMATNVDGPVDARTSNGSVTVALSDAAAGPVAIHSSNGSVQLRLGSGFQGTLSARTSNGSVTVPGAAKVKDQSRTSATIAFSDTGAESTIETSNGSVRVER
jgi:hypothetical protein